MPKSKEVYPMKRIAVFLLCIIMCAMCAIMSGCGANNNEADPTAAPTAGTDTTNNTEDPNMNKIIATIEMEDGGIIKLELYPDIAPQSVYNFVYLARQGFYDGLTFHRIISGFMIQGGDPKGTGTGGPGYCIKGEFAANGFDNPLKHTRGVISWARQSKPYDSAGSQFFIMHQDAPHLDGQYAAFGMVIEGMDVVDKIASVATGSQNRPIEPVVIKRITVEGPELPEPDKIG